MNLFTAVLYLHIATVFIAFLLALVVLFIIIQLAITRIPILG